MIRTLVLAVCVFACVPAQASPKKTLGDYYAQAARGSSELRQHRTKRSHYRRYYRRAPIVRPVPPDVMVDEEVVARHEYRCTPYSRPDQEKEPIAYQDLNVSSWLAVVSAESWYRMSFLSSKNRGQP